LITRNRSITKNQTITGTLKALTVSRCCFVDQRWNQPDDGRNDEQICGLNSDGGLACLGLGDEVQAAANP